MAATTKKEEKPKTTAKKTAEKKETVKKEAPKKEEKPKAAEKKTAAKPAEEKKADKPKTWHITKRADANKWQVKAEGNEKATKLFNTKAEAEEYVKTLVSNNEGSKAIAHKKDGKFQKK